LTPTPSPALLAAARNHPAANPEMLIMSSRYRN
jgi:hypothetical protein